MDAPLSPAGLLGGKVETEKLKRALATLCDLEKDIAVFRFGLDTGKGSGLEKTAEKFGVTTMRVRQIEKKVWHRAGRL